MMELFRRLFGRGNKENLEVVVTDSNITELEFEEFKKNYEDDNDNLKKEIEILNDKLIKTKHAAVESQKQLFFVTMEIYELNEYNYNCEEVIEELRKKIHLFSLEASLLKDSVDNLIVYMDNNKAK